MALKKMDCEPNLLLLLCTLQYTPQCCSIQADNGMAIQSHQPVCHQQQGILEKERNNPAVRGILP